MVAIGVVINTVITAAFNETQVAVIHSDDPK